MTGCINTCSMIDTAITDEKMSNGPKEALMTYMGSLPSTQQEEGRVSVTFYDIMMNRRRDQLLHDSLMNSASSEQQQFPRLFLKNYFDDADQSNVPIAIASNDPYAIDGFESSVQSDSVYGTELLKQESDEESILSSLGIDDPSIYSVDASTTMHSAKTEGDISESEIQELYHYASYLCRNRGRKDGGGCPFHGTDSSFVYDDVEDYNTTLCNACIPSICQDYKAEVNEQFPADDRSGVSIILGDFKNDMDSNETKLNELDGIASTSYNSLEISVLDYLSALIWTDPKTDPVMDEDKSERMTEANSVVSHTNESMSNDDTISQNSASEVTTKQQLAMGNGSCKESDGADPITVATNSPTVATTGRPRALDAITEAQQNDDTSAAVDTSSLIVVSDLNQERVELESDGEAQSDNELNRRQENSGVEFLDHLAALIWTSHENDTAVEEDKLDGTAIGESVLSQPNVPEVNGGSTSQKLRSDNVSTIIPPEAAHDRSSKNKRYASFTFVRAMMRLQKSKPSKEADTTVVHSTSTAAVAKASQNVEANTANIKKKSSIRTTRMKTPKSSSNSARSSTTLNKNIWKEYIDASSGRPYYSNRTITTWNRPVNAEITISKSFSMSTPSPTTGKPRLRSQVLGENIQYPQTRHRKFKLFTRKVKSSSIADPCIVEGTPSTVVKATQPKQEGAQIQKLNKHTTSKLLRNTKHTTTVCDPSSRAIKSSGIPDTRDASTDESYVADLNVARPIDAKTVNPATAVVQSVWREYTDRNSGNKYYSDGVNTTWEKPFNFNPSPVGKVCEESTNLATLLW